MGCVPTWESSAGWPGGPDVWAVCTPGRAVADGLDAWASRRKLLVLVCPSSGHHSHLKSEPVDSHLFVSLYLPFCNSAFQKNFFSRKAAERKCLQNTPEKKKKKRICTPNTQRTLKVHGKITKDPDGRWLSWKLTHRGRQTQGDNHTPSRVAEIPN